MQAVQKPLPEIDEESKPFWDAVKKRKLMIQRCKICGKYTPTHYPIGGAGCPEHGEVSMDWTEASGKGTLFTFVVFQRAFHPAVEDEVPYNVSVIELDEGPLVMSNVVECNNEDLKIGMSVETVYEDLTGEEAIFKFRPVT